VPAALHQYAASPITLLECLAMDMKTFGSQPDNRANVDAGSHHRAQLIKKAQESVRASHQRMRSRIRKSRV
jgi:hypothetical protein